MKVVIKVDSKLTIAKLNDVLHFPVVITINKFDEETVQHFREDVSEAHETGQPVIPIIIDSYGGSTYGTLSILSIMENAKLPIATICTSKAMSAGAIVFAFGTKGYRFMDPNAYLMIHDAYTSIDGKVEDIKVDAKHLEQVNTSVYKRMAKHLGHPENYFLKLIEAHKHTDWFLTAKEAKKHGIVNHLRVPNMDVNINLDINFK